MRSRAWIERDAVVPMAPPRVLCLLLADRPAPAALIAATGAGATLETFARPALGSSVTLHHPQAGTIAGEVAGHDTAGIRLTFARDEAAVAFALAVTAAGMIARR